MRKARIIEEGAAYYHTMSRVVDRRFVFDEAERERVRKLMRAVAGFSGVDVLTYTVLSNHFHLVVYVPEAHEITDVELGRRLGLIYDRTIVESVMAQLASMREAGNEAGAEELKRQYTRRMNKLPEFMKMFKQGVSLSYNRRHGRKGTLWEERYRSVLLGEGRSLVAATAYVDLNAVRAGLVADPKDYRFCGYGEAMGGGEEARAGLRRVMREADALPAWSDAATRYREWLFLQGEQKGMSVEGRPVRAGFSYEAVQQVLDRKGRLSLGEVLRCRVRYFTDGAIFGTREFVEAAFQRHHRKFSAKRVTGARGLKGAEWGDLWSARQLRVDVIGVPATS